MSRYIDADALCEALMERRDTADKNAEKLIQGVMAEVVTPIVVGQPHIDIVRCKECRYYHQLYGCQKHDDIDLVTSDDDYCSYGERSE